MQSWEIALDRADPMAFTVHLAADRLLPATDPYSRQVVMSIGGFLALVEDAAAALGYRVAIVPLADGVLPEGDGGATFDLPVASVKLDPSSGPSEPGYLDAISSATVKAELATLVLSPQDQAVYLALNRFPGIRMEFLQENAALHALTPVLKDAFRLEMTHGPTLAESYDLMRRNTRQIKARPWGLSYGSGFPLKSLGSIEFFETLFPMKMATWGGTGADNFDREVDRAGSFLLIATQGNSRLDQLQAGMLFQRAWMTAIRRGAAVVPASQPLQEYAAMGDLYRAVHASFARPGETIQMIALLGVPGEGFRRGFRISTEDLVRP